MAITFAFPTSRLFHFLAEKGRKDSYYMQLAAKFVHFVLVQILALLLYLFSQAYGSMVLRGLGVAALIYALLVGAATVFALFGVAQLYNNAARYPDEE